MGSVRKSGWNLRIEMVYRLLEIAPIFNGLFADSVVGATSGRPLSICRTDKTENVFPHKRPLFRNRPFVEKDPPSDPLKKF